MSYHDCADKGYQWLCMDAVDTPWVWSPLGYFEFTNASFRGSTQVPKNSLMLILNSSSKLHESDDQTTFNPSPTKFLYVFFLLS